AAPLTYTLSLHDALPIFMHVEALERAVLILDLHETRAALHQPPSQQQTVTKAAAVIIRLIEQLACADLRLVRCDRFRLLLLLIRSEEHTSELQSQSNLVC